MGLFRLTAFLTLILYAIGFVGIIGPLGDSGTAGALGVLIGARLSDTIVSHVLLYTVGYRPNPGLSSTPLYVVEAVFLGFFFKTLLAAHPDCAVTGFAIASSRRHKYTVERPTPAALAACAGDIPRASASRMRRS